MKSIFKILSTCQQGSTLYCPLCGTVKFERIEAGTKYPIVVRHDDKELHFTADGRLQGFESGECMLLPGKDYGWDNLFVNDQQHVLYRTNYMWEVVHREQEHEDAREKHWIFNDKKTATAYCNDLIEHELNKTDSNARRLYESYKQGGDVDWLRIDGCLSVLSNNSLWEVEIWAREVNVYNYMSVEQ